MAEFNIQVCGTRTLTLEEFEKIKDHIQRIVSGPRLDGSFTKLEDATFTLSHFDWGAKLGEKFRGHINIDLVGGTPEQKDQWRELKHWESRDRMLARALSVGKTALRGETLGSQTYFDGIKSAKNIISRVFRDLMSHGKSSDYAFQLAVSSLFNGSELQGVKIQTNFTHVASAAYVRG